MSEAIDAPLNSSISSLNLALQNASVMATNAVYGTGMTASSTVTNTNNATAPSSSPATSASTISNSATSAKKKAKKEKSTSAHGLESIELVAHSLEISALAWNPQLPLLASASADSTVRLFTLPTGAFESAALYEVYPRNVAKNSRTLEHVLFRDGDRNHDVTCLDWRRDGSILATGCYDGKARIWTAQGDLVKTLQRHSGPIFTAKWSPSGRFLLTGGVDGVVIIWDVEGGGVRHQLTTHTASCLDAEWLDETRFVTVSSDRTGLLFDLNKAPTEGTGEAFEALGVLEGHVDEVNTCRYDSHSGLLATCSDDHTARLWKETQCFALLKGHEKEIYTLKWCPNGFLLATASFDNSVLIWNAKDDLVEGHLRPSQSLLHHSSSVYSLAWSPCGKYLATGSLDESVAIWNVSSASGKPVKIHTFTGAGGVYDLDWRESWIAAGMADGRVIVIEFTEKSVLAATADSTAVTAPSNEQMDTEPLSIDSPHEMQIDKEEGEVSMSD